MNPRCLLVVAIAAFIAAACGERPLKKVASNWFVDDDGSGKPAAHLYWVQDGKRTVIDRQISTYASAGCLIYETSRPSLSRVVFGVLPGKTPVAVASSDAFRPFKVTLDGLRRFEMPKTDENGRTILDMDFIASSDICSAAYTQPPFNEAWTEKENLDFTRVKSERIELDVNGVDSVGNTTLADEVRKRHADVVSELVAAGANVNAANNSGVTPLMIAVGFNPNSTTIEQRLLDAGADIDDQDNRGTTALMYAARYGRKEALLLLLARGANPAIRDNQGRTAAAMTGNSASDADLTKLLEQAVAQRK